MPTKFKQSIEQLKTVVEMTGASGEWQDKGNGHWQFRANDGAILNWWQSSGTLSFQGPQQEKQEFEQIVQLAIAKLLDEGTGPSAPAAPPELLPIDPLPIGRYRHYKGNEYEVLGIARHSETLEQLVVYRALYGERGLWVRPRAMFVERITVEGKLVPRFEYIGPK